MRILPLLALLFLGQASAADLRILSAGAVESGLHPAIAAFEKRTGHHVEVTFNTTPQIQKRVTGGEAFDVVIAPPAATEGFVTAKRVDAGGVNLGRVGVGVAVRPGAPKPDLSSTEAFKRSLLEAESIVFNRASTGLYLESLFRKLGVWSEVEAKSARYADGVGVFDHVLKGKGRELGFGAMTEILLYKEKGLVLVGPLPPETQNYTSYVASSLSAGANAALARELVTFLGDADSKKMFTAAGIE
jgi:molybdate transport system substrate-binding protein